MALVILLSIALTAQAEPSADALEWFRKGEDLIGTAREYSDEQVGCFEKALEISPGFGAAHYNLAVVFHQRGDLRKALQHLDSLIALEPENPRALGFKGLILVETEAWSDALPPITRAVSIAPEDYHLWEDLAHVQFKLGDFEGCLVSLGKVLELNPSPSDAYFSIGLAQMNLGRFRDAAGSLQRYLDGHPKEFQALLLHGIACRKSDDPEGALESFLEAEKVNPNHPELNLELGNLLLEQGQGAEANARLRKLSTLPVSTLANLGILAKREGRLQDALASLRQAVSMQPESALLWGHLGDVLAELGDPGQARDAYRKALQHDGRDFDSLLNLGALEANSGQPEEARELIGRALEVRPDSGEAHYRLGVILEGQGEPEVALEHYSRALSLGFDQARLHFRMAVLFAGRGEKEQALEQLAHAFEKDPSTLVPIVVASLREVRGEFESIRYSPEFNRLLEQYRSYWNPPPRDEN